MQFPRSRGNSVVFNFTDPARDIQYDHITTEYEYVSFLYKEMHI